MVSALGRDIVFYLMGGLRPAPYTAHVIEYQTRLHMDYEGNFANKTKREFGVSVSIPVSGDELKVMLSEALNQSFFSDLCVKNDTCAF